jgi:hypothetical protein
MGIGIRHPLASQRDDSGSGSAPSVKDQPVTGCVPRSTMRCDRGARQQRCKLIKTGFVLGLNPLGSSSWERPIDGTAS